MDKRVFIALEVFAPWPDHLPEGRCLEEGQRHLTIAFLGSYSDERISDFINLFPKPSFFVSPAGVFSDCIFLPNEKESVVAWSVDFLDPAKKWNPITTFLESF